MSGILFFIFASCHPLTGEEFPYKCSCLFATPPAPTIESSSAVLVAIGLDVIQSSHGRSFSGSLISVIV